MDNTHRLCWSPYILRALRYRREWSLHNVCEKWRERFPDPNLKISKNQVLAYELGQSVPGADRVALLCEVFCITPDFLYTRTDQEMQERMGPEFDKVMLEIEARRALNK